MTMTSKIIIIDSGPIPNKMLAVNKTTNLVVSPVSDGEREDNNRTDDGAENNGSEESGFVGCQPEKCAASDDEKDGFVGCQLKKCAASDDLLRLSRSFVLASQTMRHHLTVCLKFVSTMYQKIESDFMVCMEPPQSQKRPLQSQKRPLQSQKRLLQSKKRHPQPPKV